ncbi:MAG: hypothetical protein HRT89_23880 [Lentisphaeria bacterium]|nr:hypothetical protein [Lentisphaeria bacterium]NQZ71099.1 hypothetical protein [Lentisphaeria bacterium]
MPYIDVCPGCNKEIEITEGYPEVACPYCQIVLEIDLNEQKGRHRQETTQLNIIKPSDTPSKQLNIVQQPEQVPETDSQNPEKETKTRRKLTSLKMTDEMTNIKIASPVGVDQMSGLMIPATTTIKRNQDKIDTVKAPAVTEEDIEAKIPDEKAQQAAEEARLYEEEARIKAEQVQNEIAEARRQAEDAKLEAQEVKRQAEEDAKHLAEEARQQAHDYKRTQAIAIAKERAQMKARDEARERAREKAKIQQLEEENRKLKNEKTQKHQKEVIQNYEEKVREKLKSQLSTSQELKIEKSVKPELVKAIDPKSTSTKSKKVPKPLKIIKTETSSVTRQGMKTASRKLPKEKANTNSKKIEKDKVDTDTKNKIVIVSKRKKRKKTDLTAKLKKFSDGKNKGDQSKS